MVTLRRLTVLLLSIGLTLAVGCGATCRYTGSGRASLPYMMLSNEPSADAVIARESLLESPPASVDGESICRLVSSSVEWVRTLHQDSFADVEDSIPINEERRATLEAALTHFGLDIWRIELASRRQQILRALSLTRAWLGSEPSLRWAVDELDRSVREFVPADGTCEALADHGPIQAVLDHLLRFNDDQTLAEYFTRSPDPFCAYTMGGWVRRVEQVEQPGRIRLRQIASVENGETVVDVTWMSSGAWVIVNYRLSRCGSSWCVLDVPIVRQMRRGRIHRGSPGQSTFRSLRNTAIQASLWRRWVELGGTNLGRVESAAPCEIASRLATSQASEPRAAQRDNAPP